MNSLARFQQNFLKLDLDLKREALDSSRRCSVDSIPSTATTNGNGAPHSQQSANHHGLPLGRCQMKGKGAVERASAVFLGGSCNPTTWRKDTAIPMLESFGISYYNPQVSEWEPKLIEIEHTAKENADVLFFVVDHRTRAVTAMIEVAFLAGAQRKLILVLLPFEGPGAFIDSEKISEKEYQELHQSQNCLKYLVERQGIPVFGVIKDALNCTAKLVKDKLPLPRQASIDSPIRPDPRDVYLGGDPESWRQEIAIPLLRENDVSFYTQQSGSWRNLIENSRILLFVIISEARSVLPMLLACHYVGLGWNVVLCIQDIPEDAVIDGEQISQQAVKDYNRGRAYLADMATRTGVPVYKEIKEAVACAIARAQAIKRHS